MAFKDMVLGDFTQQNAAVVASDRTTVREALALVANHNLLAMPVVKSSDGSCLGLVTTFDIVNQLITFIHKEGMGRTEEEIDQAAAEHLQSPITVCFGVSKESSRIHIFESSDHLEKVLPLFAKGIQRVVVVHKGEAPKVLSQLDVIRFLSGHFRLSEEIDRSVDELGIYKGPSKVMILYEDRPAITGFALMAIHRLRVVPIVNLEGKAVTQIGEGDLRGLNHTSLQKLTHPITEFTKWRHPAGLPSPFCKKSMSLRQILGTMIQNGFQRVWVLDDTRKIVGVITALDIITKFACYERRAGD